jgi:SAM-dependent methyltransferase
VVDLAAYDRFVGGGSDQLDYWNTLGATKTFTHPVGLHWLEEVDPAARILDYGCGYGRVAADLADAGFSNVVGVDIAPSLVARARRARPDLRFEVLERPPGLPADLGRFDVVLLVAVLTCVVEDESQRDLVATVTGALSPGALLFVSDLLLQEDQRHQRSYDTWAARNGGPYGCFETSDGATCRHHDLAHLLALFDHLSLVGQREVDVTTMNGNPARAVQLLFRSMT